MDENLEDGEIADGEVPAEVPVEGGDVAAGSAGAAPSPTQHAGLTKRQIKKAEKKLRKNGVGALGGGGLALGGAAEGMQLKYYDVYGQNVRADGISGRSKA